MKLTGKFIYLKSFEETDAESLLDVHCRNREFWQQYTSAKSDNFYTKDYQVNRIQTSIVGMEEDRQYDFGIFQADTDELIGVIALTEVVRGPLQACWLGYSLDKAQNGRGYTSEAVSLVVKYAFEVLRLHRIEAGVMPHNTGSIKVVERAGFHCEGLSKKNVKINGKWQDHLHFALINPDD